MSEDMITARVCSTWYVLPLNLGTFLDRAAPEEGERGAWRGGSNLVQDGAVERGEAHLQKFSDSQKEKNIN